MKSLICAAIVAGSMCAMAEETAPEAEAKVSAVAKKSPEALQAKRLKMMAERKAARDAKMLEVVKKYVPEEEKAKALLAELQAAMKPPRRPAPRAVPRVKKAAEEAK